MAFTRPGQQATSASAPTMQAQASHFMQPTARTSSPLVPSSAVSPTEIITMDGQHLTVSFEDVRNVICPKATDAECKIFLETCRQYKLNPFTKEAHLIHYDNNSDATASSIVLGKACYMQMAERHPQYDGFEAGVIVMANGQLFNREGAVVYEGEELLGGWARVYRKDRSRPYYEEVPLKEYDKGQSKWKEAPATMIRKVALVHALREAFPTNIQGMYDADEVSYAADYEGDFNDVTESVPRQYAAPRQINASAAVSKDPLEELSDEPIEDGDFK